MYNVNLPYNFHPASCEVLWYDVHINERKTSKVLKSKGF